ncbi:unnamed protein product [Zymoseptoria tritici ST99CH_1A5]|nr:unnamed protein product [Zymoseptoria tritici ST99CH_3D1]SMY21492.1 unnamed protein product [Zymoseptoria tritici ST99CH_1A5]
MRLFLLPVSTRRTLIYAERVQLQLAAGAKPPLQDRLITRVSDTWAKWEKAEKGWQKKLTTYGNQGLRRIPFEEWGLKSLPSANKQRLEDASSGKVKYECLYPGAFVKEASVPAILSRLATERQGLHSKRMWNCLIFAPFTIPFALVPVIPNIPFFYLMFRAWSHYKALYGSKMLEHLTKNNLIKAIPSQEMDERYAAGLLHPSQQHARDADPPSKEEIAYMAKNAEAQTEGGKTEVMLLESWNGSLLAESFKLPELDIEVERAVWQAENAIKGDAQKEKDAAALKTGDQTK